MELRFGHATVDAGTSEPDDPEQSVLLHGAVLVHDGRGGQTHDQGETGASRGRAGNTQGLQEGGPRGGVRPPDAREAQQHQQRHDLFNESVSDHVTLSLPADQAAGPPHEIGGRHQGDPQGHLPAGEFKNQSQIRKDGPALGLLSRRGASGTLPRLSVPVVAPGRSAVESGRRPEPKGRRGQHAPPSGRDGEAVSGQRRPNPARQRRPHRRRQQPRRHLLHVT